MQNRKSLKVVTGVFAALLLLVFLATLMAESWAEKRIEAAVNSHNGVYRIEIGVIDLSLWGAGLDLKEIRVSRRQHHRPEGLAAEISSIKLKGINIWKALGKREVDVRRLIIAGSRVTGNIDFSEPKGRPKLSSRKIRIRNISVEEISVNIQDSETAQRYRVNNGNLRIGDLDIQKGDTLAVDVLNEFDFSAGEMSVTLPDSFYTVMTTGLRYSENTLTIDSLSLRPNYPAYAFTDLHPYETDRFDVVVSGFSLRNFSVAAYLKSGDLVSTYAEIGELNMNIFRDKREEFRHRDKAAFQEVIRSYSGRIAIDSVAVADGEIRYTEHDEEANEPGYIRFNDINAGLYHITNDTVEHDQRPFRLTCRALLMGSGILQVSLESKLSDRRNTFFVAGTLSEMEIADLNPILDKNAYMYVNSGVIDEMSFRYSADDVGASGKITLLYHDLNVTVKNKETDKTTAVRERLKTLFANIKMMHSNPMPGEEVREGEIDYLRDPEKFLFNYCFKSILSGIESTVTDKSLRESKSR